MDVDDGSPSPAVTGVATTTSDDHALVDWRPGRIAVFNVAPILVVTVEDAFSATATHVNVGGQGAWVARAVTTLGGTAVLCAPFGGDVGRTARLILVDTGFELAAIETSASCGLYVERRDAEGLRHCLHHVAADPLGPRDMDDLYDAALRHGIDTGTCVVTGSPFPGHFDADDLGRLCRDLAAADVTTVADLSGEHLDRALDAGVDWLKVADDELVADGRCGDRPSDIWAWLDEVVDTGQVRVAAVASSATGDTLARTRDRRLTARIPSLEVVDSRGSGDSMCAALALAHSSGASIDDALRAGLAAGAANATRRSTASPGIEVVASLMRIVEITSEPVGGRDDGGDSPPRSAP